MLDKNTWNHIVCKIFLLGWNTWYHTPMCKQIILDETVCKWMILEKADYKKIILDSV